MRISDWSSDVCSSDLEDAADSVATLRIHLEKWGSTPISIDQFGRAQEYTLRYAVVFSLDKADGTNVVPEQTVELARDYVSVPTRSTGTEGERELLAREMQKEMTASRSEEHTSELQ